MAIEKIQKRYEVLIRFDIETGAPKGAHQRMMQTILEDGQPIAPPQEMPPTPLDPGELNDILDQHYADTLNRATEMEHSLLKASQAVARLEEQAAAQAKAYAEAATRLDEALQLLAACREKIGSLQALVDAYEGAALSPEE